MLTRDDVVKKLRDQRSYLATEYGVSKIGIFGSYAKGHATPNSDVDLVVEFEKPIGFRFIELAEYLELLLGQRVDLLTPAGIQNIRVERVAQRISESILYV